MAYSGAAAILIGRSWIAITISGNDHTVTITIIIDDVCDYVRPGDLGLSINHLIMVDLGSSNYLMTVKVDWPSGHDQITFDHSLQSTAHMIRAVF